MHRVTSRGAGGAGANAQATAWSRALSSLCYLLLGACIAGLMMKSGDGTALSLLGGGSGGGGGMKVSAFPPQEQSRHRLLIFYHVFASNNWKLILRDQINKIMFSGLYDHLDGIYAVICGNFEEPMIEAQDFLESFGNKFKVKRQKPADSDERETLHYARSVILPGDRILYIHSKGVSDARQAPDVAEYVYHWRSSMEYFMMKHFRLCLTLLESKFDAIGVNLLDAPWWKSKRVFGRRPHFSGNMWWTTAEHWAQLPVELPKTRHAPEYFSTYKDGAFACVWSTGFEFGEHYYLHYWPSNYADVVDRASCDATISKAFGLCSCGFFDALGKWDDWSSDTMPALDGSNATVERVAAMELQRVGPSYVAHIPV